MNRRGGGPDSAKCERSESGAERPEPSLQFQSWSHPRLRAPKVLLKLMEMAFSFSSGAFLDSGPPKCSSCSPKSTETARESSSEAYPKPHTDGTPHTEPPRGQI